MGKALHPYTNLPIHGPDGASPFSLMKFPHHIKLSRSVPQDAPREVFAQLLPTRGKTRVATGSGLVTSVLAPIAGLHGGNGAKQIDVIAR